MESNKFDQLEEKIKKVVDTYVQLKQRTGELEELIRVKDQKLGEAQAMIQSLQGEKEAVRTRIDSLLQRIDKLDVSP